LVPAPDGVGFIGTDPAFNAQITDVRRTASIA
jgi:hypothetical protein